MQAPPLRPRRRWWPIALAIVAILILVPTAWMYYSHLATQNAWDAAMAEAALDLPR